MTRNRKLYESIMKDISKTVKKYLNENNEENKLIEDLKNEIIYLAKDTGEDFIDLEHEFLTATITYNDYDEAGRQVDDFSIIVNIKAATIDVDLENITLQCETSDDDVYYEDEYDDNNVHFDGDVYLDDILNQSEKIEILTTIIKNIISD